MIAILALWDPGIRGLAVAFAVVTPIYLLLCIAIVIASDEAFKKGMDLTGLETLRELERKSLGGAQWFQRIIQKILRSRKLIFWVGSWFHLDPDYVTLLLRRKEEGYAVIFLRITLPSVVVSMVVWLAVWWFAVNGFRWAVWAWEWVL
jgi:hypothetical protein